MTGKRPNCPNCRYEKARGLYSRPQGKYERKNGLYECSGCGCIFFTLDRPGHWGYTQSVELVPATGVPQAWIDIYDSEIDPSDELVDQVRQMFGDAAADELETHQDDDPEDDDDA